MKTTTNKRGAGTLRAPGADNRAGASKSHPATPATPERDAPRASDATPDGETVKICLLVPVTVAAALAKLAKAHGLALAETGGLLLAAMVHAMDGASALAALCAGKGNGKAKGGAA